MVKKILVGLVVLGVGMGVGVGQARAASMTGYDTIDLGNSSSKVYANSSFMAVRTGRNLLGIKSASEIRMFGDITAGNTLHR